MSELKAAKARITRLFRKEFVALHAYDRRELVDSVFGDMAAIAVCEHTWDELALTWRFAPGGGE